MVEEEGAESARRRRRQQLGNEWLLRPATSRRGCDPEEDSPLRREGRGKKKQWIVCWFVFVFRCASEEGRREKESSGERAERAIAFSRFAGARARHAAS